MQSADMTSPSPDPSPPLPKGPPFFRPARAAQKSRFGDAELLGFALRGHVPDPDLAPTASRLLAIFGSFSRVVTAPSDILVGRGRLPQQATDALAAMHEAAIRLASSDLPEGSKLDDIDKLLALVQARHSRSSVECVHAFFLDAGNHLLLDEIVATGTVNHAPVYPREILRRAIDCDAVGMIVVHNHPSGDPTPSLADHRTTRELARAAEAIGVKLLDHLIVSSGGHISFRQSGWL